MKDLKFKIGDEVKVSNPKVKDGKVEGHRIINVGAVQYLVSGRYVPEGELSPKSKGQKNV